MSSGQNFSPPRDLEALLSKKCKAESKLHEVLCLLVYQSVIMLHLTVHGLQSSSLHYHLPAITVQVFSCDIFTLHYYIKYYLFAD